MAPEYRAGAASRNSMETAPTKLPRSFIDRPLRHTTTLNAGFLCPMFVDEILPGDTVRMDAKFFTRVLAPLEVPCVDEMTVDAQAFFVPFRLVYTDWKRMMGERDDPDDHNDYLTPKLDPPIDNNGFQRHSLADYFGVRTETDNLVITSLYHRAYQKIWNDFYRDENLQDSLVIPLGAGPDPAEGFPLMKRGKMKDYITGCLPFLQKGPAVSIPIGASAPVIGQANLTSEGLTSGATGDFGWEFSLGYAPVNISGTHTTGELIELDFDGAGLTADLSAAGGINISDFRELVATQHLLERDARGGTRYVEILENHFGVTPEDSRLQRAEFLWSTSAPMSTHVVPSTVDLGSALAELGGYMQGLHQAQGFTKSFSEHGALMVLVSIRAPLRYQQNIPKMFKRDNRFDYYWNDFALLSEQPVLNYEVYADGTAADDDIFGYQPRYEEYRRRESMITGALRSDDPLSLDVFTLSQDFATRPALDADFIEEDPPIDRIVSIATTADFMIDCRFGVRHVRPMPMFANPGLLRL